MYYIMELRKVDGVYTLVRRGRMFKNERSARSLFSRTEAGVLQKYPSKEVVDFKGMTSNVSAPWKNTTHA